MRASVSQRHRTIIGNRKELTMLLPGNRSTRGPEHTYVPNGIRPLSDLHEVIWAVMVVAPMARRVIVIERENCILKACV